MRSDYAGGAADRLKVDPGDEEEAFNGSPKRRAGALCSHRDGMSMEEERGEPLPSSPGAGQQRKKRRRARWSRFETLEVTVNRTVTEIQSSSA